MKVRLFTKLRRDKKGQSMVEFALILPLLVLLLMAILELGSIFHSYLLITYASREGVRMGVVGHADEQINTRIQEICSTLDGTQLTVKIEPTHPQYRTRGIPLTVKVDYKVTLFTPLINAFLPDPFLIHDRSVMRVE